MIDAVFISDLHLHPDDIAISERFNRFVVWAKQHTKTIYILGDLFHVWPGDDSLGPWSEFIAQQFSELAMNGIKLYYMHGNRDFLLGKRFAKLASFNMLSDPTTITLGNQKVMLSHGDRYCINDRAHQWLRCLTRNALFTWLFLKLPYSFRNNLVNKVRQHSEGNRNKSAYLMDIVPSAMLAHMKNLDTKILIHGHIHKPGCLSHVYHAKEYLQYVLSDWDDNPSILCYDREKSFYFVHI